MGDRRWAWIAVLCIVAVIAVIRLRLADAPLERDEGEYAYAGQLILQGVPPYSLVVNMKFPGTYYAYALVLAVFGQTAWGIHAGLLVVSAASTLLMFLIGRRLFGDLGAVVAAAMFALLSLDRGVLGGFAHATHFIVLPTLAGILIALRARADGRSRQWLWSGACFGVATAMNQMGAPFLLTALLLAVWPDRDGHAGWRWSRGGLVIAGALVPVGVMIGVLWLSGVLSRAAFWTLSYARAYVSETPWSAAGSMLAQSWPGVVEHSWPLWALAGVGAIVVLFRRSPTVTRVTFAGLLISTACAVSAGFYFRNHYFVLAAPLAGLAGGAAASGLARAIGRSTRARASADVRAAVAIAAVLGVYVIGERHYLFAMSGSELTRVTFEANPFADAPAVARYLASHTSPDERILVLGSEPEIYFYAQRRSATGYIYMYPLLERQPFAAAMQDEMFKQIDDAAPKFLVAVWIRSSWINSAVADQSILDWANRYSRACYELAGIADIGEHESTLRWDADAASYRPTSQNVIYTLRRKPGGPCRIPLH